MHSQDLLYAKQTREFLGVFAERDTAQAAARDESGEIARAQEARSIAEAKQVFTLQYPQRKKPDDSDSDIKTFGRLHPVAFAKAMIKKHRFPDNDAENLLSILRDSSPIDRETGLFDKKFLPFIVGLAHLNAQESREPVCYIEGDFCNMGGANIKFTQDAKERASAEGTPISDAEAQRLGREATDKLLHKICMLVKYEFNNCPHKAEVQGVRKGGDEICFVVYGLDEPQAEKILLERVHPLINRVAAEFGVHDTPHEKKNKFPGFGADFACVDLSKPYSQTQIREKLDAGIEQRKTEDGMMRLGLVTQPALDKYVHETYGASPPAEKVAALQENLEVLAPRWKKLTAPGAVYEILYKMSGARNPVDFFNYLKERNRPKVQKQLGEIELSTRPQSIPFLAENNGEQARPGVYEAPQINRKRRALQALGFNEIAADMERYFTYNPTRLRYEIDHRQHMPTGGEGRKLRMAIDLMNIFDAPDPASRCQTTAHMKMDAENYLRCHGGMKAAHFEISNISGLNNISYDLADAVLREAGTALTRSLLVAEGVMKEDDVRKHMDLQPRMSKIFGDTDIPHPGLGAHVADHIYARGGGKFMVLLPEDYDDRKIEAVGHFVAQLIDDAICDKRVDAFVDRTLANPGKQVAGQSEENTLRAATARSRKEDLLKKLRSAEEQFGMKPGALQFMNDIPHPKGAKVLTTQPPYSERIRNTDIVDVARKLDKVSHVAEAHYASPVASV